MRRPLEALGAVLGFAFVLSQAVFWLGTSSGVVREYCLDERASTSSRAVEVDSSWTYILWPPLFLSALDPPGRCVRNAPLRQGLSEVGVWKLPSPEEQVRDHIEEQLKESGAAR